MIKVFEDENSNDRSDEEFETSPVEWGWPYSKPRGKPSDLFFSYPSANPRRDHKNPLRRKLQLKLLRKSEQKYMENAQQKVTDSDHESHQNPQAAHATASQENCKRDLELVQNSVTYKTIRKSAKSSKRKKRRKKNNTRKKKPKASFQKCSKFEHSNSVTEDSHGKQSSVKEIHVPSALEPHDQRYV